MTDPSEPVPVRRLRGQVTRKKYGKGSKSEREAVFISTDAGEYLIRRKTGPAFGDAHLERYVGCSVECDGYVIGTTLLAERIDVIG